MSLKWLRFTFWASFMGSGIKISLKSKQWTKFLSGSIGTPPRKLSNSWRISLLGIGLFKSLTMYRGILWPSLTFFTVFALCTPANCFPISHQEEELSVTKILYPEMGSWVISISISRGKPKSCTKRSQLKEVGLKTFLKVPIQPKST